MKQKIILVRKGKSSLLDFSPFLREGSRHLIKYDSLCRRRFQCKLIKIDTHYCCFFSGGSVMSRVGGFSSVYLAEDIEYLHRISLLQTIHGDFTLEMAIRGTCTCIYLSIYLVSLEGDFDF